MSAEKIRARLHNMRDCDCEHCHEGLHDALAAVLDVIEETPETPAAAEWVIAYDAGRAHLAGLVERAIAEALGAAA